jgi:hypothetical protein
VKRGGLESGNNRNSTENDNESDSDGSFNLLPLFREREKSKGQEGKKENPKSERSDECDNSGTSNPGKGDDSTSFSDDDNDPKDKSNENSSVRKVNKSGRMPRKARAADDEFHVDSEERSRTRVPKSISVGKKKAHLSSSSDSSHDEGSGLETDDHETTPFIRQHGKSKSRNIMTLNYDTDDQSLPATRTKETPAPTSHADDNDDGFMSDYDASPAPQPKKQVKEDTASRCRKENSSQKDLKTKGRKKRASSSKQGSARIRDSDNYSFGHQKDPGGKLEDLHPNFENPKFGPYELEPLLLSNDQVDTVVQVPASLSRYLAPFQKEGVRFMYECLARKSGVILGDEMVRGFSLF